MICPLCDEEVTKLTAVEEIWSVKGFDTPGVGLLDSGKKILVHNCGQEFETLGGPSSSFVAPVDPERDKAASEFAQSIIDKASGRKDREEDGSN